MARTLFELKGLISVDGITDLFKGLSEIDKQALKVSRQIDKFGRRVTALGVNVTKMVSGPLIALGGSMVLAANKAGEYADKMLDLKDITGLSTDNLQRLEHVAKISGSSFDALTNTITMFTRKLPSIIKEGGPAYDTIKQLGINIYDASGNIRDMNELFPDMLKKLMAVDNVTQRNAMATTIFGKSLNDLAPLLGMSSDEFDKLFKEADKLNTIISEESLRVADQYRQEMAGLIEQFTLFWRKLAIDFIPVLSSIIPLMRDMLMPIFEKAISIVKGIAEWYGKLTDEQKAWVIGITGALAVAGPLLILIGKVTHAFTLLAPAIALVNKTLLASPWYAVAVAIGVFTLAMIKANAQTKKAAESNERANTIIEEMKALKALKTEYEGTLTRLQMLQRAGKWVDPDEIEQAKNNIATLNEEIIKLNKSVNSGSAVTPGEVTPTKKTGGTTPSIDRTEKIKKEAEAIAKAAQEEIDWQKRIIEQRMRGQEDIDKITTDKLALLELAKQEELNKAGITAEEKLRIDQYYETESLNITNDAHQQKKDLEDKAFQEEVSLADKKQALLNKQRENEKKAAEERIEEAKKDHDTKIEIFNSIASAIQQSNDYISQIIDNYYQKEFNLIATKEQKEIDAVNRSTKSEEWKAAQIDAIHNKYAKEEAKLKKEQAKKNKAFALFNAIIGTAAAIVNALQLVWPLNLIMAILVGVMGAIQIAAIASQPLPLKKGGLAKSKSGGIDATIAEGGQDELILPMKTGVQALAEALMEKLRAIEMPKLSAPQLAFAGSGGGSFSGSGSGRGEVHLHIGTLVADDSGLKQLERVLFNFRVADEMRKGRD